MADPLSPATRATKRNLLVASVLAISANAFNVSIDKIPVGGLSITFDDRLFAFLLLIVLIYFLCTFVLYYAIDMKNYEATPHQTSTEKTYHTRIKDFPKTYFYFVVNELRRLSPAGYLLNVDISSMERFQPQGTPEPFRYTLTPQPPKSPFEPAVAMERKDNDAVFFLR